MYSIIWFPWQPFRRMLFSAPIYGWGNKVDSRSCNICMAEVCVNGKLGNEKFTILMGFFLQIPCSAQGRWFWVKSSPTLGTWISDPKGLKRHSLLSKGQDRKATWMWILNRYCFFSLFPLWSFLLSSIKCLTGGGKVSDVVMCCSLVAPDRRSWRAVRQCRP